MRLNQLTYTWRNWQKEVDEIKIELCRTNLEQLLKQMNEFPDAPNWIYATCNGVQITISAKDNTGVE
jgi:hypothetical protein